MSDLMFSDDESDDKSDDMPIDIPSDSDEGSEVGSGKASDYDSRTVITKNVSREGDEKVYTVKKTQEITHREPLSDEEETSGTLSAGLLGKCAEKYGAPGDPDEPPPLPRRGPLPVPPERQREPYDMSKIKYVHDIPDERTSIAVAQSPLAGKKIELKKSMLKRLVSSLKDVPLMFAWVLIDTSTITPGYGDAAWKAQLLHPLTWGECKTLWQNYKFYQGRSLPPGGLTGYEEIPEIMTYSHPTREILEISGVDTTLISTAKYAKMEWDYNNGETIPTAVYFQNGKKDGRLVTETAYRITEFVRTPIPYAGKEKKKNDFPLFVCFGKVIN